MMTDNERKDEVDTQCEFASIFSLIATISEDFDTPGDVELGRTYLKSGLRSHFADIASALEEYEVLDDDERLDRARELLNTAGAALEALIAKGQPPIGVIPAEQREAAKADFESFKSALTKLQTVYTELDGAIEQIAVTLEDDGFEDEMLGYGDMGGPI